MWLVVKWGRVFACGFDVLRVVEGEGRRRKQVGNFKQKGALGVWLDVS